MSLRICENGHGYFKTSDCPTCPICEQESKPHSGLLSTLGAPARRTLENNGINSLEQLSNFTENQILKLHGIGPTTIPKLKTALKSIGLTFKENGVSRR